MSKRQYFQENDERQIEKDGRTRFAKGSGCILTKRTAISAWCCEKATQFIAWTRMTDGSTMWRAREKTGTLATAARPNWRASRVRKPSRGHLAPACTWQIRKAIQIRRVDLKSGIMATMVGTGQRGDGPDGEARQCRLARPPGISVSPDGVLDSTLFT
jgi:hypothetical protein